MVLKIVNRHRSNENSALFGLRKTGKTSVIFAIKRTLEISHEKMVFIDCQDPAFHKRRWNKALYYILTQVKEENELSVELPNEFEFTETNASILFEKFLLNAHKKLNKKSLMMVFDEIENIAFNISPTKHWKEELDFLYFWQTLRSLFQKHTNLFSYLIIGTNPKCIETATIHKKDNPIFNQIYFEYIPNFDVPQTREMTRKLGRIMGLKFDEIIYSKLTEDFGGHPFLIRHVCSIIHKNSPSERPVRVDKSIYEKAKQTFNSEYSNYIEMILTVLNQFYPDEFEMLKYIALDDMKTFKEFAELSHEFTNHLLGYKIIDHNNGYYSFKIEAVKDYLTAKHKYEKALNNTEERWKEISERRNRLEPKLRKIVKNQLQANLGKSEAFEAFLNILGNKRKDQYVSFSYQDLFDPNKSKIYLEDLRKAIIKKYKYFENIFGKNKQQFDAKMESINQYRYDAHAKNITKEEMVDFRTNIKYVEKKVEDFI